MALHGFISLSSSDAFWNFKYQTILVNTTSMVHIPIIIYFFIFDLFLEFSIYYSTNLLTHRAFVHKEQHSIRTSLILKFEFDSLTLLQFIILTKANLLPHIMEYIISANGVHIFRKKGLQMVIDRFCIHFSYITFWK